PSEGSALDDGAIVFGTPVDAPSTKVLVRLPGGAEAVLALFGAQPRTGPWYWLAGALALASLGIGAWLRGRRPPLPVVVPAPVAPPAVTASPPPTAGRIGRYAIVRPLGL